MRIPRFAFAAMIVGMLVLACSLVKVRVGAHSEANIVMMKVMLPDGTSNTFPLVAHDKQLGSFAALNTTNGTAFGYSIKAESQDGNRVQLAIRTKLYGHPTSSYSTNDFDQMPPQYLWFTPGETLKVELRGVGELAVTGEWMDHIPQTLDDPAPDELRVMYPMLLRDKTIAGDVKDAQADATKPGEAVNIYLPGHGRFIFSLTPMKNAVQGQVYFNRVFFRTEDGSYTLLTGSPIARSREIWVLQQPDFRSSNNGPYIGAAELSRLAPDAIIDQNSPQK